MLITTRPPNPPQFDVSFPEKLLKIVATRGEIFSLKFGNLPPSELEGWGGGCFISCDIIIGGLLNVTVCDRGGQFCCKIA